MQINEFIESVCKQIKYKPIRKYIAEELTTHIEEVKEEYISNGIREDIAEMKSIQNMGEPKNIGKVLNKIHKPRLDYKLLLIAIVLLLFGLLVSIIRTTNLDTSGIEGQSLKRFTLFAIIGFLAGVIIYFIDYRKIFKYSKHIYLCAIILVLFTLIFGFKINGTPILYLKIVSVSPSIIALPLYIIAFAGFIQEIDQNSKKVVLENKEVNLKLIEIIVLSLLSIISLLIVSAFTATIILSLIYLIISTAKILSTDKNRKKNILQLCVISTLFIILIIMYMSNDIQLKNYTRDNFDIESKQDLIISMSNLYGKADVNSEILKAFDEETNFAFISILAHYGWIIAISMVLAITLLCIKLVINSMNIKEKYGRYLMIGISSMFIFEGIFSVLMNLNLGIKGDFYLPFISWGGINLVTNIMCLGLMLSIYRRKDILVMKETMQLEKM